VCLGLTVIVVDCIESCRQRCEQAWSSPKHSSRAHINNSSMAQQQKKYEKNDRNTHKHNTRHAHTHNQDDALCDGGDGGRGIRKEQGAVVQQSMLATSITISVVPSIIFQRIPCFISQASFLKLHFSCPPCFPLPSSLSWFNSHASLLTRLSCFPPHASLMLPSSSLLC
jgi:hypothetical protein